MRFHDWMKDGAFSPTSPVSRYGMLIYITMAILTAVAVKRALPQEAAQLSPTERIQQDSPLQYELIRKNYDAALELMSRLDNIDSISPVTGLSALGMACRDESADSIDMVRAMVLEYGADVKVEDGFGNTALHYASGAGNLAVVRFLIQNGADLNAVNLAGAPPLFSARERKRNRIEEELLKMGARDLTPEQNKNAHTSQVIQEAMGYIQASMAPAASGEPSVADFRSKVAAGFNDAANSFRAGGRIEEMALIEQVRDNMLRAIDQTPKEEGMSMPEWSRIVSAKMQANMQGDSQEGGPP